MKKLLLLALILTGCGTEQSVLPEIELVQSVPLKGNVCQSMQVVRHYDIGNTLDVMVTSDVMALYSDASCTIPLNCNGDVACTNPTTGVKFLTGKTSATIWVHTGTLGLNKLLLITNRIYRYDINVTDYVPVLE